MSNLIKSITEEEWFLAFITALDAGGTLAVMTDRGLYDGVVYGEANPFFEWAMQQGMHVALAVVLGTIILYMLAYRMAYQPWKNGLWYSVVAMHALGIISWLAPPDWFYDIVWTNVNYDWMILQVLVLTLCFGLAITHDDNDTNPLHAIF